MIPASVVWVAFLWRLTMLTPSSVTRPVLGKTRSTRARFPLSSPETTCTMSPLVTGSLTRGTVRLRIRRRFLNTSGFMSDDLRRERDDLHVLLLAQLARHGPEDAGRPGLPGVVDQHRRVLVEADVGAVLAAGLLGGPHDHRPGHVALLDLAGGDGVLDRHDHDVAQPGVAALGAPQHADHQGPAGARVVGDLEDRFLLHHGGVPLLGPLDDLGDPPTDEIGRASWREEG